MWASHSIPCEEHATPDVNRKHGLAVAINSPPENICDGENIQPSLGSGRRTGHEVGMVPTQEGLRNVAEDGVRLRSLLDTQSGSAFWMDNVLIGKGKRVPPCYRDRRFSGRRVDDGFEQT